MMRNVLLSLLLAAPVIASAADTPYQGNYTIVPLAGEAKALNNAGQVLGEAMNNSGFQKFLYLDGPGTSPRVFTDIPTGYPQNVTAALNDVGTIAVAGKMGESSIVTINGSNVNKITLPNPSGAIPTVRSINKSGQILTVVDVSSQGLGHLTQLYTPGRGVVTIGDAGRFMGAQVNDAGTVVGVDAKAYPNQAYLYANGRWAQLGGIQPAALNNSNVVVGRTGSYGAWNAAMWANGKMTELGRLPGGSYSEATDINDSGEIVGTGTVASTPEVQNVYHGFVYRSGKMIDLNTLVDRASGWTITGAKAINEKHQILVDATDKSGNQSSLLLTPATPLTRAAKPASNAGH